MDGSYRGYHDGAPSPGAQDRAPKEVAMSATGHSHSLSTHVQASQWPCDNCTRVNPGDRKRCTDCGTSRH